ncbi:hypothetical protein [Kalamiella sp. sgz302252]|uniref:hypothetical protein n=1 Tax=Pantoea sp. sgz302252 TaxID=3341827 RepID=UPI0036D27394
MSILNLDWKPEFGTIYTWFAMDKFGKIAVMVNNCFGDLPKAILSIENAEVLLDELTDYMWEESDIYDSYPENKMGDTKVDLYSAQRFSHLTTRDEVDGWIKERSHYTQKLREYSLPSIKGLFVYHAVEGSYEGEDYPVGYESNTKTGDYFRFLMPTVCATIDDFPYKLRRIIAVSKTIDFSKEKVIDNDEINEFFPDLYIG